MTQTNPLPYREPLRADGNLSYLQFIAVVKEMWKRAHPDIPIVPTQGGQFAVYPAIVYSISFRKTHPDEPKPRYRQRILESGRAVLIHAQRFQNLVSFSAVTEPDQVDLCEQIIEIFEDFMFEHVGVLKELGVSDIFYARRLSDDEENRAGTDICKRTVQFLVTTEKVIQSHVDKLKEILIDVRLFLHNNLLDAEESATPSHVDIIDNYQHATPED